MFDVVLNCGTLCDNLWPRPQAVVTACASCPVQAAKFISSSFHIKNLQSSLKDSDTATAGTPRDDVPRKREGRGLDAEPIEEGRGSSAGREDLRACDPAQPTGESKDGKSPPSQRRMLLK